VKAKLAWSFSFVLFTHISRHLLLVQHCPLIILLTVDIIFEIKIETLLLFFSFVLGVENQG
jgi:hypothetical protein